MHSFSLDPDQFLGGTCIYSILDEKVITSFGLYKNQRKVQSTKPGQKIVMKMIGELLWTHLL